MEEAIRFIKQSYRLEDMRLLNYARLKNMAALVVCAAVFASGWIPWEKWGMSKRKYPLGRSPALVYNFSSLSGKDLL